MLIHDPSDVFLGKSLLPPTHPPPFTSSTSFLSSFLSHTQTAQPPTHPPTYPYRNRQNLQLHLAGTALGAGHYRPTLHLLRRDFLRYPIGMSHPSTHPPTHPPLQPSRLTYSSSIKPPPLPPPTHLPKPQLVYPFWIVHSTLTHPHHMIGGEYVGMYMFYAMLFVLQFLHIFW